MFGITKEELAVQLEEFSEVSQMLEAPIVRFIARAEKVLIRAADAHIAYSKKVDEYRVSHVAKIHAALGDEPRATIDFLNNESQNRGSALKVLAELLGPLASNAIYAAFSQGDKDA